MSNQQTSAREARISVFFPLDAQIIYGYFPESGDAPEQKANQLNNDKPAETKEQVIADAKIQIENMMRRLRVLNVEENIFAPDLPPRTPTESLSKAISGAMSGAPAWPELYKHLSAALREAERLTPASKLTDDESGETD